MTEDIINKIRKERGYVLKGHSMLGKYDPDLLRAYDDFYESVMVRDTAIDKKTKELIVIAVLATRGLYSPFKIHAKRAIELGASINEIIDALSISGLYAGAPSMLYALEALHYESRRTKNRKSS